MLQIFDALLKSVGLLVAASFVMGLVFERVKAGHARGVLVGLVGGLFAALSIVVAVPQASGMIFDGRTAIILVTGLFAGPLGAVLAVPIPAAVRFAEGGPTLLWAIGGILIAYATGAIVHLLWRHQHKAIPRKLVVVLALASPLPLAAMLLPNAPLPDGVAARAFVSLLIWLPIGTLVFGLLVANEQMRSVHARSRRREKALLSYFGGVSCEVFDQQLQQQHRMYARYGCLYSVLLIAVDPPSTAVPDSACADQDHDARQRELARAIKNSVRECDVVCVRDETHCAVILPFVSEAAARPVAQRIQDNVAKTFADDPNHPLTVSIGIADASKASSAEEMIVIAEGALFLAGANAEREAIGPPPVVEAPERDAPRSFPGTSPADASREELRPPCGVIRLPTTGVLADPGDGVGERVPPGDLVAMPIRGKERRRGVA